ncbi:Tat-translocated enzyme [Nostocoides japonicum T1-X7]|uniref:Tat-translocated enzyme n=1 Tax=Nostocoides japonicum T1-X7 TaxID=1194083 RepID=A0A077M527_9MICO|nr:Dyp-type peroxidase [Tetrasphaera japonica]CCH79229.1 Tat-translocated enzyme [Tetrasphaera japonica T1-X7]
MAVGALAAGGTAWGLEAASGSDSPTASDRDLVDLTKSHAFYDQPHPPGIQTPPQRHCIVMTFDMSEGTVGSDLQTLLARWSAAISRLMAGQPVGQVQPTRTEAIGQDTGEASGLDPASLTVTVGLGPGLFDKRFGLATKRPALLRPLPVLPSDALVTSQSGGDLSLQVCSDDPQVTYHAVRNLARMARDTVQTRWTVIGFGRASAGGGQQTPRNLLGFKDGTRNVREPEEFDRFVWLKDAGWMTGGTYQVVRKIEMDIEIWDADRVSDQEHIFGRTKLEGAPLTGRTEMDTPNFSAQAKDGTPVIDPTAHIALAAAENNQGVKILRRGYNYTDGINQFGQLDAGLLFIAYVNDPQHFITLQRRLGASDLLNEYISHVGSGIFAVPPTPATGHYIGEQLFA